MTSTSANLGEPPSNQDDFFIVRGIFRSAGLHNADASKGWVAVASEPPDYQHETKQPAIIAGMVVVMVVIIFVTAARLALRFFSKRLKFGSDDWIIMIAAAIAATYPILQMIMVVQGGAGQHVWEVTYEQYNIYAYYGRLCQIIFYVAVGLIKISITLFIRRIVRYVSQSWTIVANVVLTLEVAYVLLAVAWQVFLCRPPRANWDRWYSGSLAHPASCWDTKTSLRTLRVAHLVLGVLLLLMPVAIIWSVRMGWQKKARLFFIWAAGALSVIGGLLQQLQTISNDSTWSYTDILVWTCLDLCMGIITASLPVMDGWLYGSWDGNARRTAGAYYNEAAAPYGIVGSNTSERATAFTRPAAAASSTPQSEARSISGREQVELRDSPLEASNPMNDE